MAIWFASVAMGQQLLIAAISVWNWPHRAHRWSHITVADHIAHLTHCLAIKLSANG
jgi:hypothetical protein